jgi:pyruvate formate lyase activating enzyme
VAEGERKGLIFDIRSYALHDGPGLRTTVFFKGCPLHCLWCCNPESQERRSDLVWLKERCLACDLCLPACPQSALRTPAEGGKELDPARCDACGACAEQCPGQALNLMGRWLTAAEVLREVMKDALYSEASGGGLTLSGGEPLAQPEFAAELLWRYKHEEKGAHAALETCGAAPWWQIERLAADVDLFLFDLKHMDPDEHLRLTGRSNEQVLENARRLAEGGHAMVMRMPLIPGVNDDTPNLAATAAFVRSLPGVKRIDLLPYHRLGEPKYRRLGRDYPMAGSPAFGPDRLAWARDFMEQQGLEVQVGG